MADEFDPTTAPAFQEGAAMTGTSVGAAAVRERTHEEIVRSRLGWIQAGVWVIAGVVILEVVVGFFIGFSLQFS